MTHKITVLPNGSWKQNCYVVSDEATGLALLIDPGSDDLAISQLLSSNTLTPVAILNTHAHYDHIGAVAALIADYNIPFFLHSADGKLLKQANLYKVIFESKESLIIPVPTHDLSRNELPLKLGGFEVTVLYTPGHTMGSVCLKIGADLFSGDTLLPNGPGRSDLPGGDKTALTKSIELLRTLPEGTKVWPGHGRAFSLASLLEKLTQAEVQK